MDIIVAASKNNGIGKDGKLPWKLKNEMNTNKCEKIILYTINN